ncbi:hypothetical protein LMG1864_06014 [Achromobacter ruhlandii]|nr:hypothetical protein LMG1864_06014 [Achromobacter ruhlandii]
MPASAGSIGNGVPVRAAFAARKALYEVSLYCAWRRTTAPGVTSSWLAGTAPGLTPGAVIRPVVTQEPPRVGAACVASNAPGAPASTRNAPGSRAKLAGNSV